MNTKRRHTKVTTALVKNNVVKFPVKVEEKVKTKRKVMRSICKGGIHKGTMVWVYTPKDPNAVNYVWESMAEGFYYIMAGHDATLEVDARRDPQKHTLLHVYLCRTDALYDYDVVKHEVFYALDHSDLLKDITCIKFHTRDIGTENEGPGWLDTSSWGDPDVNTVWLYADSKPLMHIL